MAAEIEQLPDLSGYLKIASRPEWLRVALRPPARLHQSAPPKRSSALIARAAVVAPARVAGASEEWEAEPH